MDDDVLPVEHKSQVLGTLKRNCLTGLWLKDIIQNVLQIDNLVNDHESRNCHTYWSWTTMSLLFTKASKIMTRTGKCKLARNAAEAQQLQMCRRIPPSVTRRCGLAFRDTTQRGEGCSIYFL